jgi:hypothetical protein
MVIPLRVIQCVPMGTYEVLLENGRAGLMINPIRPQKRSDPEVPATVMVWVAGPGQGAG